MEDISGDNAYCYRTGGGFIVVVDRSGGVGGWICPAGIRLAVERGGEERRGEERRGIVEGWKDPLGL